MLVLPQERRYKARPGGGSYPGSRQVAARPTAAGWASPESVTEPSLRLGTDPDDSFPMLATIALALMPIALGALPLVFLALKGLSDFRWDSGLPFPTDGEG